ncbi:hypothetical protein [Streptomyces sp. NPDC058092]|uniref:hypothetical protein n=1 Tax=Streptomyces sp. NPDC058092 TaxID=3346336 RepID=UPI0036E02A2A
MTARHDAAYDDAGRTGVTASTLWWNPGSSNSMASAYLKSMRQRTASAACRSD